MLVQDVLLKKGLQSMKAGLDDKLVMVNIVTLTTKGNNFSISKIMIATLPILKEIINFSAAGFLVKAAFLVYKLKEYNRHWTTNSTEVNQNLSLLLLMPTQV